MNSTALVTGIAGRDGSYPTAFVLSKGDVDALVDDPSKAERLLSWEPKSTLEFPRIMVDAGGRAVEHELAGKLVRIDR